MRRAVAALIAVGVLVVAALLLRAELMTVEVPQPEGSWTDVVVHASTVREEPEVIEEMTRGLVSTCRLLVDADVVEDSFLPLGGSDFGFRLRPGLDEFQRREMKGCLSDLRVQHLLLDVRRIVTTAPDAGEDRTPDGGRNEAGPARVGPERDDEHSGGGRAPWRS